MNKTNDIKNTGAAQSLPTQVGSRPIYPQPANRSDASWAGAQVGGITLREYYVGQLLAGYQANAGHLGFDEVGSGKKIAKWAVTVADETIKFLSENSKD